MPSKEVPTVAKRNDPAAYEPYAKSQSTRAENQDPNFAYEWFRADQLEEKLNAHEYPKADQGVGFLMVAGWQHVLLDEGIVTGRGPASDGKPIDSRVRKGDLWLCKLPKAEHAKYGVIQARIDERVSKRIAGERHNFGSNTSFKSRVVGGRDGLDAETSDILGAA